MKVTYFAQLCYALLLSVPAGAQQPPNLGNKGTVTLPDIGKVQVGNAQKAGSGNGDASRETQSAHDAPIIISDGSVRIQVNDVFSDLTNNNASYANWAGQPHTLLASHTHAKCNKPSLSDCACSDRKQVHNLYVYKWSALEVNAKKPIAPTPQPISDCDTVMVFLERADAVSGKWVPSSTAEIQVAKRYVPIAAFGNKHPAMAASVVDQQAWLVSHAAAVALTTPKPAQPYNLETVGKYRLGRVEVQDANGAVKFTSKAANSCTILAISPWEAEKLPPPCALKVGEYQDYRKVLRTDQLILAH